MTPMQNVDTLVTIISDLHTGSAMGMCPLEGYSLDDGGCYMPSIAQQELGKAWNTMKEDNKKIKAKKRVLIVNGDVVDGVHHNTVALATNNIQTQESAAVQLLTGLASSYDKVFMTRGTEAHVGSSGQSEERVAKAVGAEKHPDTGNHASWQWWFDVDGFVLNVAHHIGTTSSAAYESSAVMREMVAALVEAGQWEQRMPDILVRSHRHRYIELAIPSSKGKIIALVTPGWQLRTPFVERIDRMRLPHIGCINLLFKDNSCQVKEKIFPFQKTMMVSI